MKYSIGALILVLVGVGVLVFWWGSEMESGEIVGQSYSEVEVGFEADPEVPMTEYVVGRGRGYTLEELRTWTRPDGPVRVGLQVGHLDNTSMPEELRGLEGNTGAVVGSLLERDVVQVITELTAEQLRAKGIVVDILPATVPPGYVADAFVSIHADGNSNTSIRGFKMAGPRRDYSGQSAALVDALYEAYGPATGLPIDPSISRRMTAYYAFNWPRYEYAIHPLTPAVIVETGFLTSPSDRELIVNAPERAADGIANGIEIFLNREKPPRAIPPLAEPPTFPVVGEIVCAPVRADRRNRDDGACAPAVKQNDSYYLLPEFASSSDSVVGQTLTLTGTCVPVQTLDNYFWFQYEVAGIIAPTE